MLDFEAISRVARSVPLWLYLACGAGVLAWAGLIYLALQLGIRWAERGLTEQDRILADWANQ